MTVAGRRGGLAGGGNGVEPRGYFRNHRFGVGRRLGRVHGAEMSGDRQQARIDARPECSLVGLALFAPAIKPLAAAERMRAIFDGLAGAARQLVMRADRPAFVARVALGECRARLAQCRRRLVCVRREARTEPQFLGQPSPGCHNHCRPPIRCHEPANRPTAAVVSKGRANSDEKRGATGP